jgi:hypothetical protein
MVKRTAMPILSSPFFFFQGLGGSVSKNLSNFAREVVASGSLGG